ncbi:hypothetical protein N7499_008985 [Penicillium canescens]|nr:hypothetical protein N7499_008985 [Penicillium canescens]
MWSSSLSNGLFLPLALLFTSATADDKYNNRLDTTATNAGPLTTVFTPAASCATPAQSLTTDTHLYYKAAKVHTEASAQRAETTAYCCPDGFECKGQNYCAKSFNTISTMTYVDATLSTQRKIYGITASPIQIRFKAAQSTIVPVPTDSLSLPRRFLYTHEKIGIGIGVPIAVALLTIGFFWWRRSRTVDMEFSPSPRSFQDDKT